MSITARNGARQYVREFQHLLLLFVALCFIPGGESHAALVNVADYKATVTASTLNVRSGPSTRYRVIGQVYKNITVTVTHHDGSWRKISWRGGATAYVYGTYLRKVSSSSGGSGDTNITDYYASITASRLNIRSGPGTNYRVIGSRSYGQRVRVTHRNGVWRRITWSNGARAYAHGNYLRRVSTTNPGTQECSAAKALPSYQLYNNARAAMSGESGQTFSLQKDPSQGIVVVNAWIRGTQRQTVAEIRGVKFQTDPDSDRGATRYFRPGDSRATVVLDYFQGKGYALFHSTTFRANLRLAPDVTITRSAYSPKLAYATNDPTWFWEDSPVPGKRRLRVHVTAKPLTGGIWDTFQATVTPSVDFQIVFNKNINSYGSVSFQGDSFPNFAVYRYKDCSGSAHKSFDKRHPRHGLAWAHMSNFNQRWWYDRPYTRYR